MNAVTRLGSKVRRLAGATVGIPPRQINFRFRADSPRYMYGNNATASLHFAVLSGFFPPGEMFFVESVRRYRGRISDQRLKAEVSGLSARRQFTAANMSASMLSSRNATLIPTLPNKVSRQGCGCCLACLPVSNLPAPRSWSTLRRHWRNSCLRMRIFAAGLIRSCWRSGNGMRWKNWSISR